jgi:arylsulfatase A-like enzyme
MTVGCLSERVPSRPDFLLITIDTLRADALAPYGGAGNRTPAIARLADEGTVYKSATAPMPFTRPTHGSILTGLYPDQHGVLNNAQVLPEHLVTLAECLREVGYQTAGFVGAKLLGRDSGIAQGFNTFEAPQDKLEIRAETVVERALDWLNGADQDRPVFLWIHFFDPHQPYNPPSEFRRGINPEKSKRIPLIDWVTLDRIARNHDGEIPVGVLKHAKRLYRGEVEYTDWCVGNLLRGFDELRDPESSMVILTSDHGECFENGIYFEHADCLFEGGVHVPLIVRYPGGGGGGLRVARRVSNIDITPTVLRQASLPLPDSLAGRPLDDVSSDAEFRYILVRPPALRSPDTIPPRARVIRSVAGDAVAAATDPRTRGVVDREWKYLFAPGSDRLFLLPDESSNRAASDPAVQAQLRQALSDVLRRFPAASPAPEADDEETIKMLEALGYVN